MIMLKTDKVTATSILLNVTLTEYTDVGGGTWEEQQKQEDKIAQSRISALGGVLRNALGSDERKLSVRAAAVRAKLTKLPPPGAHWANSHGCGTKIEGVEDNMIV